MRVLAIDPGVTTGWAVGVIERAELTVVSSGYDPWLDFVHTLYDAQLGDDAARRFDHVVYETWQLYADKAREQIGSRMESSQCVGVIRFVVDLARRRGQRVTISDQGAGLKKVIDARMGGAAAYLPTSAVEHDRDAIRHLWYYYQFNNDKGKFRDT